MRTEKQHNFIKPEPAHLTPGNPLFERKQQELATIERISGKQRQNIKSERDRQEQQMDETFAVHGKECDTTHEALHFYLQYLAKTNGKARYLRPTVVQSSKLDKKRRGSVTRFEDADDYVTNLWFELVHPTDKDGNRIMDGGIFGFTGINDKGKQVSLAHWVNSIFSKHFGRKFKQAILAEHETLRIDEDKQDDSAYRTPKNHIDVNKLTQHIKTDHLDPNSLPEGLAANRYLPEDPKQRRIVLTLQDQLMWRWPSIFQGLRPGLKPPSIAKLTGKHVKTNTEILANYRKKIDAAGIDSRTHGGVFRKRNKRKFKVKGDDDQYQRRTRTEEERISERVAFRDTSSSVDFWNDQYAESGLSYSTKELNFGCTPKE